MGMQEQEEDIEVSMEEEDGSGKIPVGSSPDDFRILEAVLFASDELLTAAHLKSILPGQPDARKIRGMVEKINVQLQKERHPFEVVEIGGGYQFRTITYYHPWVRQIFKEKVNKKLSIQALECLAIIAYKQPISKAEIESVRGVVSDGAMKTLLEKRLVTVSGRSEKPGRPLLYGSTQTFLTYFGLNKIEDLPRIEEFEAMAREKMEELSIDELAAPQPVSDEEAEGNASQGAVAASGIVAPAPAESSVFEVEITPNSKMNTPSQNDEVPAAAEENDDAVEILETVQPVGDGTGEDTVPIETGKVSGDSDESVAPVARAAAPMSPPAETEENEKVKSSLPQPEDVEAPAETAFDLESMIVDEDASNEKSRKDRSSELEGIVLRGETAFDLEAIVIEDPQINFPPSYKRSSANTAAKKPVVNETAFDIELMPKARPKKQRTPETANIAPELNPEALAAKKTITVAYVPESAKKAPLPEVESVFEFNAPFATSDAAVADNAAKNTGSHDVEQTCHTPPAKPDETACFDVGASAGSGDDAADGELLSEELKETTVLLPGGVKKNGVGKAADQARKTGGANNEIRKKGLEGGSGKSSNSKPASGRADASEQSDNA